MTISVGRYLKRKTMLVYVKEYINKNFVNYKSLCNLQKLFNAFKQKHPNVNVGFSKFGTLRPKWFVLAGSKMTHSVCVCSAHQNIMLLIDTMDWDLTYKDLHSTMFLLIIYRGFNGRRFLYSKIYCLFLVLVASPFALSGTQDQIWKCYSRKYCKTINVNNTTMLQY